MLWDDHGVIVDTRATRDFAGEKIMRPYRMSFDVGHFGDLDAGNTGNAAAPRRAVPFVVQIDDASKAVNIGIVSGSHGTHVAGIAAGHGFFDGAFDGAAPGARVVSVRVCLFQPGQGCTAHALVEGMIFAVKEAKSDVVNMSIGGLPALNDGNNPRAILYNELIETFGVQMFISAGNSGPGVNTVGDPSVATKVLSVGAYWSKPTVLANYGATVTSDDALHDFSSRGPREDGFTKPQIVAPGSAVSAVPLWREQQCLAYRCDIGHGMFNGTSMAAPQATGGAALLISAAKQTNVESQPAQLRQALMSSARLIPDYKIHEQGAGLMNVEAAWNLLKQGVRTWDISSSVSNNTVLSAFLATPGIGAGIHEREGLTIGQSKTFEYTFTSGGGGTTFNVSLIGDTSAFGASAATITMGDASPATLPITFRAQSTPGIYSVLLNIDDPATIGIDYQIMNTVFVHDPLAAPSFTAAAAGSAKRFEASREKFVFDVPAGTTAVQFSVTRTNNGRVRYFCIDPQGIRLATTGAQACGSGFFGPAGDTMRTSAVQNPLPGVWEIAVVTSRADTADGLPTAETATFGVTATAFKATFSPESWINTPTTVGVAESGTFDVANDFGDGIIGTTGSSFASARRLMPSIAAGAPPQVFEFAVRESSTLLTISTRRGSDPAADLDLFVFHCPSGPDSCTLRGSGTGPTADETVTIANPPAGLWRMLVDPFAVPAGSTTYTYSDVFVNSIFGAVSATSAFVERESGSTFSITATGTAASDPGADRFLVAAVTARLGSPVGVILGSAEVEFRDISP